MNKEDILAKSRKENEGKSDEREAQIFSDASKVGITVGGLISVAIVLFSRIIDMPLLGLSAWAVFFPMFGSRHLYHFIRTKEKDKLIAAMIGLAFGLACLIGMVVLGLQL